MLSPIQKIRLEIRAARHSPKAVARLKEFSYVAWLAERIFLGFEFLSPSIFFIPTRSLLHSGMKHYDEVDQKETYMIERMRHRAKHVDTYILCCMLFQVALGLVLFYIPTTPIRVSVAIIAVVRVLDIVQANVNLNVFDRLRFGESSHVTVSVVRNLILAVLTYLELMLSFGLLYAIIPKNLAGRTHQLDAYYFSMVTQLTIGYGDIRPLASARYIATVQGTVGLFFSLLIMGRFVSLLPNVRTVVGDEATYEK